MAEEECIPRAVDEFPQGPISQRDIHNGAFVLHILIALYMFLALAIVCDDFFVPSLEILCEKCHMSEDVAGATFMSAGSSAPEFFTSLIGMFNAKYMKNKDSLLLVAQNVAQNVPTIVLKNTTKKVFFSNYSLCFSAWSEKQRSERKTRA